ncbi:MAG: phenylalanine--tRNA ligase subunit beta [Treponema sp.]|nr:phenylalanine--tRNA ligase subunit beta [Treponema sp.]
MPKIEVNETLFFNQAGKTYDYETLAAVLPCVKGELDETPDETLPAEKRSIKIELNDTNRPDLWSLNGIARQLRLHRGEPPADYTPFLSTPGCIRDSGDRFVTVDAAVRDVRPYMVAFVISGKPIEEPMLVDIIQTQEKLAWNFGRKRKSISMGVYRAEHIRFPVHYKAVDPDTTSFVPLGCTEPMTCRQILTEHPKGRDYGWILQDCKKFPLLTDDTGEVMSMAPIINSATLGAVRVGDVGLMVELTGDNIENLLLSANIVACDFADCGYEILPVRVDHPYETGFGKSITAPFYFQKPTTAYLSHISKLLGQECTVEQVTDALTRMGSTVTTAPVKAAPAAAEAHSVAACTSAPATMPTEITTGDIALTLFPPPYRNDFLHEVDVIEDVMIGCGVASFLPEPPRDFTIGRLLPITRYSRTVKTILIGLGYQEMIFNYVGSKKNYIDNMGIDATTVIEIANPMSENYQFIRPDIISSLLKAESISASAQFPHKIFEIGKVAYLCDEENTGTRTRQHLGFLTAAVNANFNDAAAEVSALLYFLDYPYVVRESNDPRFISGRQVAVIVNDTPVGIFGEVHPRVLENWQITMPCIAGEFDVDELAARTE